MGFGDTVIIEVIKTAFSLALLGVTWFVGQRVIYYWDVKRKAREADLAIATQFQQLFGEFKEVWRVWKAFKEHESTCPSVAPDGS